MSTSVAILYALQAAYTHISAARWEVDLYRPTRQLPVQPFTITALLCRAILSSATLLLYNVESGGMRLRLCAEHGPELEAVAGAFHTCCK